MREEQPIRDIGLRELLGKVEEYHMGEYRLVQISCTKLGVDSYEFTYSFDKGYRFESLRVTVPKAAEIPSITGVYKGAFLYENEINELFGANIKGLNVDYRGTLYMKRIKDPFSQDTNKVDETCQRGQ